MKWEKGKAMGKTRVSNKLLIREKTHYWINYILFAAGCLLTVQFQLPKQFYNVILLQSLIFPFNTHQWSAALLPEESNRLFLFETKTVIENSTFICYFWSFQMGFHLLQQYSIRNKTCNFFKHIPHNNW